MNGSDPRHAAASQLQVRANLGRQLLQRPIETDADLDALSAARVEWMLGNKKLLHEVLGDAAAQIRLSHAGGDADMPLRPQLADRVREFQTLVIAQIADLEKLIAALKRMG